MLFDTIDPYFATLQTLRLERFDRLDNALLQALVLQAQNIDRALVVIRVQALVRCPLGVVATRCRVARQVFVLREVLLDDLCDLLVREIASGNEEPLVCGIRLLERVDVGLSNIGNRHPKMHSASGDLVLELALASIANALIGCVEIVEAVKGVLDWAKHHWRVDSRDGEVRLLFLQEFPGCLLSEGLTCSVAHHGVLGCLLNGNGVPVSFRVRVAGPETFVGLYNGSE